MCVDVGGEGLLPLEFWVGNPAVLQSEALQLARLTGQLPVHLHGCLVQDLGEETGRTGNCRTTEDNEEQQRTMENNGKQRRTTEGNTLNTTNKHFKKTNFGLNQI